MHGHVNVKILQILHCNNHRQSYAIPYNEHNCTILYLILKAFVVLACRWYF